MWTSHVNKRVFDNTIINSDISTCYIYIVFYISIMRVIPLITIVICLPLGIIAASDAGDYITSEEDILNSLARDEINFTQYYDLLELYRDKVSIYDPDLDRLLVIPGVDRRWIDAIESAAKKSGPYADEDLFLKWFPYDYERISAFIIFEKLAKGQLGGGTKIYTHGRFLGDDYPTTYLTFSGRYDKAILDIRFREDDDGFRCRRRSLKSNIWGGQFVVGSYHKGLGNGLALGKVFYVPGAERTNSTFESFSTPHDNLFNGVRFEGDYKRVGIAALISRNVYDSIAVDGFGTELAWIPGEDLRIGCVFAYGDANTRPAGKVFSQSTGSVFIDSKFSDIKAEGEFAVVAEGDPGLMLSLIRRFTDSRAIFDIWIYGADFNPMHGYGISDYRQTDIELGESGIVQDSRQAGERGCELKISSKIAENFTLDIGQSGWRTKFTEDWGLLSESGLYYHLDSDRRIRAEFSWEKRTLSTGVKLKETFRIVSNWPIIEDLESNGYFRLRWSTDFNDRIRSLIAYGELVSNHFEPLVLRLRVKKMKSNLAEKDNGYWELRFRDQVRCGPIIWVAEIRHALYDDTDKNPLTEFRITAAYLRR